MRATKRQHGPLFMSLPLVTSPLVAVIAVVLWSAAVGAGIHRIWAYEGTPGEETSVPTSWPDSGLVSIDRERATLMMFVHPLCVCTRASLTELRAALDTMKGSPSVWIVLLSPHGIVKDWSPRVAEIAARIPEATIVTDHQGTAAEKFGASTSGHVVLYDRGGRLTFSGGITAGRGHVGDNSGRRGLVAAIQGGDSAHAHPIFGCGLDDPEPLQ